MNHSTGIARLLYVLVVISLVFFLSHPSKLVAQTYYSKTKNATVILYSIDHQYILPHLERCFENALRFHRSLFDYTPSENVTVFLQDFNDYGTGGASPLPWNYLNIGIEPYDYTYETGPSNERMNWVMNHELAHIVATDKAAGMDETFRSIFFGKVSPTSENPLSMFYGYLTTPRWFCPRWYHEGFAVFLETWMAGGIGRALGGYDEMTFRAMVDDSSYFYDFVGLESEGKTIDFQVGANSYLYGTRFISYLVYQYGPDKLLQWVNRTSDSKRYFATQFESVYGVPLDDEWGEWIKWEHVWQKNNLDSIRAYPLTPFRKVLDAPLGSVSRSYYDSSKHTVYTARNLPGQLPQIISIDLARGTVKRICDVTSPALYYVTPLAYDPATTTLFYATHNSRDWRGLNSVNINSGKTTELIKTSRIGDLVMCQFNKSLYGVQHNNGYSSIVRLDSPYTSWKVILELAYGKDLFDIDISPDAKYMTGSLVDASGTQTLIRLDLDLLRKDSVSYEILIKFEDNDTAPYNFVYSPDGKYLFGTAYYSGVSNVLRYELATKELQWISNCETGYFRPLPISEDSIFVYRYSGKGFTPIMIANRRTEDIKAIRYLGRAVIEKYPVLESWSIPSPLTITLDSFYVGSGAYHGLEHLKLASAYPLVEGYKDFIGYGMRLNLGDPGYEHGIDATASYTPNQILPLDERFHATVKYVTYRWKFDATYNGADFYDLFGPTKSSRKGYSIGTTFGDYIVYDRPTMIDYSISLNGYAGLERLPDFQNIATDYDNFITLNGKLTSKRLLRTLGAIDVEEGIQWSANTLNTFVKANFFTRFYATFDYGFLLPINHSSIWIRGSAGYSPGARDESFANFYFGGFGNNWIDYQEVQRYQRYYSFPGVELNEIGGTKFGKLLVEWSLPPIRFRRFGIPNWYCTYTHLSLFAMAIASNFDETATSRSVENLGAQLDFKFILFTNLESTLSFGYAYAFEASQRALREFMVSLKVL